MKSMHIPTYLTIPLFPSITVIVIITVTIMILKESCVLPVSVPTSSFVIQPFWYSYIALRMCVKLSSIIQYDTISDLQKLQVLNLLEQ